ncbi:MAG: hypothetical protein HQM09_01840 [Candidatus Riflebacteria bacterium]|nr:hypothetical protein [Candidatus Riflebacteria bacterium]
MSYIVFQYKNVIFGNPTYDSGKSATVGLENIDGTTGTKYSYAESVLSNGQAIKFVTQTQ